MTDVYAFPVSTIDGFTQHGMTKRELIAMHVSTLKAEVDRMRNASEWQPISTAPRDGSYVWLWNKHVSNAWEAPQQFRWSTHYSVFGLGGCWTDGLCTMGDGIDFDFWCAVLPATPVNPYEADPAALHEVEEG